MSHILYLSDNFLTFSRHVRGAHAEKVCNLNYDKKNTLDKLNNCIDEESPTSIHICLDVMGEEIKQEKIPKIGKKDRERLLARKEKSLFHNADYIWKRHLYEEESGRKDHIYLLLGISLSSMNKSIIETLIQKKVEVRGIYLIPAMQRKLLKVVDDDQLLIISENHEENKNKYLFRQTFLKNRQLNLTRVTSISGEIDADICYQLNKEIERTHHFLKSSRQILPETKVRALAFINPTYAPIVTERLSNLNINCDYVSLNELAKEFELPQPDSYTNLADLLCHLAIHSNGKPNLEPKNLCQQRTIRLTKKNISYVTTLTLTVAIALSFIFLFLQGTYQKKSGQEKAILSELDYKQSVIVKKTPETLVLPSVMQQSVALYNEIQQNSYHPTEVLDTISHAYEGFFDLRIEAIEWRYDYTENNNEDEDSDAFLDTLQKPLRLTLTVSAKEQLSNREVLGLIREFKTALLAQAGINTVEEQQRAIDTRPSELLEERFLSSRQLSSEKLRIFSLVVTFHNDTGDSDETL